MALSKKLIVFIFFLTCFKLSLISQIKIDYYLLKTFVISGEKQSLNILSKNIPKGAQVFLKINNENYSMKNNEFHLTFLEESNRNFIVITIEATVKLKGKIIFKEDKELICDIEPEKIGFETSFGNVLYVGIDNYLKITTNFINQTSLAYRFNAGIIGYKNQDVITIKVLDTNLKKTTIMISKRTSADSDSFVTITEKEFVVSKLPEVNFELNSSIDQLTEKDTLMFLKTNLVAPFDEILNVNIDSFTCKLFTDNKWMFFKGNGSEIKENLLAKIKAIKPKDIIYFDHIYYSSHHNKNITTFKTLCLNK